MTPVPHPLLGDLPSEMVARLHLTDAIVPTTDGWGIVIQRFNAELAPSDVDEVLAALGDRADRL